MLNEIDMKKKAKVHRLPTEGKTQIHGIRSQGLGFTTSPRPSGIKDVDRPAVIGGVYEGGYHLYITIDEEIKEGDWFYNPATKGVLYASKEMLSWNCDTTQEHKGWKKIIASTDPSLRDFGVEQVPFSFIEEYCKAGGIDEVLVEYIGVTGFCNCKELGFLEIGHSIDCDTRTPQYYIPNLKDNTIIIHPVEEKMYSRDEVANLLYTLYDDTNTNIDWHASNPIDKWIEENL